MHIYLDICCIYVFKIDNWLRYYNKNYFADWKSKLSWNDNRLFSNRDQDLIILDLCRGSVGKLSPNLRIWILSIYFSTLCNASIDFNRKILWFASHLSLPWSFGSTNKIVCLLFGHTNSAHSFTGGQNLTMASSATEQTIWPEIVRIMCNFRPQSQMRPSKSI